MKNPSLSNNPPVLRILSGSHKGKQFRILGPQIVIGRQSDCDVIFKDNPQCSRRHARIRQKEGLYFIESLNEQNPVLLNGKKISLEKLKSQDKITVGTVELLFVEGTPPALLSSPLSPSSSPKKRKGLSPARIGLFAVLLVGALLFFSEDKKEDSGSSLDLKTEADILKEVEDLEALREEMKKEKNLSPNERAARAAFIKGFRDYRKGYFNRASSLFQHCLTLDKKHELCQSYSRKAKVQTDRMIQKKIILGNAYKKNKQYASCSAVFKSVEIMIQDTGSAVYKEAKANRELCEIQLKNNI